MITRTFCGIAASVLVFPLVAKEPTASVDAASRHLASWMDNTRVLEYNAKADSFVEALALAAGELRVPMGIQWIDTSAARAPLAFSCKNATVREILNRIVETQPGYQLQVAHGVLHVYPGNAIPDRQNFLDITIPRFIFKGDADGATAQLRPLVKRKVATPRPPPRPTSAQHGAGGSGGSGIRSGPEPPIALNITNSSVEEILDQIVLASVRKVWVVTFSESSRLTPTGYRRTEWLWTGTNVTDDEQPEWFILYANAAIPLQPRPGP